MSAGVVVVGSINEDRLVRVSHLPAPGETVIGGVLERAHGGKGANAAVAAAMLGARVALIAAVGEDPEGDGALRDLADQGVDVSAVATCSTATGVAHITIDDRAENTIAVASGANAELGADTVRGGLERLVSDATVVLADLEVPDEAVAGAAAFCRQRGLRFILDPAPARPLPDSVVAGCEALTPNAAELRSLGVDRPDALLAAGARSVVVTLGADGAELHELGAPSHRLPAIQVEAVDSTGAGDAFAAALAVALQSGLNRRDALAVAVAAGGHATAAVGARAPLPRLAELRR
ncbi:MAG: PfkB family carbohydrate kinase [Solirubrobacteraceae bacterium]